MCCLFLINDWKIDLAINCWIESWFFFIRCLFFFFMSMMYCSFKSCEDPSTSKYWLKKRLGVLWLVKCFFFFLSPFRIILLGIALYWPISLIPFVRLGWAHEKTGPKPKRKPNRSLRLALEAALFAIWIDLVERLIWAAGKNQWTQYVKGLWCSYKV